MRRHIYSLVAAVCAGAFVALAVLVAKGALTALDRRSVRDWMPWLHPQSHGILSLATLVEPETRHATAGTLVALWTYPASPVVSALLVAVAAFALVRRGARRAAFYWCLAWVAANVLELAGKAAVERPKLYSFARRDGVRFDITGLNHSFPSGHTVRACMAAAALTYTWAWLGPPALLWVLTVPVALVLIGDHAPSDVVGGLLLGAALAAAVVQALRSVRS